MVGTFLYLTACSLKNRVRRRLRRLREPRYLIGLIVGAAYFYFMIIGRVGRSRSGMSPLTALGPFAEPLAFAGSVFLLAAAAVAWVWPGSGSPLSFSRAEVQFLFPAPVTRRQLIHYKILRSQLGILFGSAVVTLIMRPGWIGGGWTFLAGLWMLLLNARLHFMAVTLTRRSLAEHGRSALLHQWGPLAVVATVITALAATVAQHWSALVTLPDTEMVFAEIQRIGTSGAAGAILWPFRALVRLPLAASPAAFAAALPPVAALLALHYVWVLRADAAFEEASAEQAERRALDRTAKPSVSRATAATPFRLALDGPPETAILWKNLILVGRYL